MSEQEGIFDDSIESLEYSELKDGHQVIPPISSFSRGSDVVEESFESAASNYYGSNTTSRNDSPPSIESSGPSFSSEVQRRVTSVSSNDNVITAAHQILGNVATFVASSSSSPPSSVSSVYASVTTGQGSSLASSQNDWTLPSASVSLPSATQNTTMAVESPQLHAALTMTCLPTQNTGLADAYSNILQQPGLHNTSQQGHLLGFSSSVIPIGINSSNTPVHGTQTIESANQRSHASKVHENIGTHSHEKAMVELDKHRNFLNNIQQQQQQQQQTQHVLPVAISVDANSFMNSSLPTAGTVAPPNTQLPPSLSMHSRPAEAGLPTRSAASHVDVSNHPTPIDINVDTVVQQGEEQVTVDGTGNRRQGKKARAKRTVPSEEKDDRYFERRKRNNQAAKRSRDARKVREEHISRRADFLERENEILKAQLSTLREEANSLRLLLSQRPVIPTMITSQGHQIQ